MAQRNLSFPEIIAALKRIHLEKDTGTFSITTESNRSAQIVIKDGIISFIYYFNKQGIEALSLMMSIESGRYRFQQGQVISKTNDLPSTPDIIRMLSLRNSSDVILEPKSKKEQNTTSDIVDFIDNDKIDHLRKTLLKIVGPAGSFLIDDEIKSMGLTLETIPIDRFDEIIQRIADNIPGKKQQQLFKDEMT